MGGRKEIAQQSANEGEKIEKIYQYLASKLKSPIPRKTDYTTCTCLISFHNCTPYRVIPYWIDFRGRPIKYSTIARGGSLNMNTYVDHLWYFKAEDHTGDTSRSKLLAVPEETLQLNSSSFQINLLSTGRESNANGDRHEAQDAMLGLNNTLICSLCKFVMKHHGQSPTSIPCAHFTGRAKFSVSDLNCKSWANYDSTYIYSCPESSHRQQHSIQRRNIYLVEPFYNLRERCFLALKERIRHVDIVDLDLPISLQKQYLQFLTTLNKLDTRQVP